LAAWLRAFTIDDELLERCCDGIQSLIRRNVFECWRKMRVLLSGWSQDYINYTPVRKPNIKFAHRGLHFGLPLNGQDGPDRIPPRIGSKCQSGNLGIQKSGLHDAKRYPDHARSIGDKGILLITENRSDGI